MKYGVVVCKETRNIGDDIQSYAVMQHLPNVDYYIDRETIDTFRSEHGESVAAVINGWFSNNKLAWPVSPYIIPLYESIHFRAEDPMEIGDLFLSGMGRDSLRECQPIGCRDAETLQLLERNGIIAYLSGCVTLTLKPKFPSFGGEYVCLTDISPDAEAFLRAQYPQMDFRIISQEGTEGVDSSDSWETRFHNVERLLTLYQNAKAVITTRLHCAFPCLALGTPVLLLNDETTIENGRFAGLIHLLNHCTAQGFIEGSYSFSLQNPPENPAEYRAMAEKIRKHIHSFVSETEDAPAFNETKDQLEVRLLNQIAWKNTILSELNNRAIKRWNQQHEDKQAVAASYKGYIHELIDGKAWLEEHLAVLELELTKRDAAMAEIQTAKDYLEERSAILEQEIVKRDAAIAEIQTGKDYLEGHAAVLEQEIAKRDAAIEELQSGKKWLENHAKDQEDYIKVLLNECKKMDAIIKEYASSELGTVLAEKKELEQRCTEKQEVIERLQYQNKQIGIARDWLVDKLMSYLTAEKLGDAMMDREKSKADTNGIE